MKKKVMAIALAAATVSSMMGASMVAAATDVANNDLAYKGDLEIMHYSTSEESEGTVGSEGSVPYWQHGTMLIRIST